MKGRGERLMAAAAITLALTGCADKPPTPSTSPAHTASRNSWNVQTGEGLLCNDRPNDTRPLASGYAIYLFQCTTPDTNLPTKRITITDSTTQVVDSVASMPPNGEKGNFGGRMIAKSGEECIVVDFGTTGTNITKAEITPCATPSAT